MSRFIDLAWKHALAGLVVLGAASSALATAGRNRTPARR